MASVAPIIKIFDESLNPSISARSAVSVFLSSECELCSPRFPQSESISSINTIHGA